MHYLFIVPSAVYDNGVPTTPKVMLDEFLLIFFFLYLVQRDTNGLTAENTELKIRLQAMEQQAQLRDGMLC